MWDLINNKGKGIIKCDKSKLEKIIEDIYIDSCALGNMSGIEIDSAKKEFDIDMSYELNRIRDKWLVRKKDGNGKDKVLLPNFFRNIKEKTSVKNYLYKEYSTGMDMLLKNIKPSKKSHEETIGLNDIFIGIDSDNKPNYKNIEKVLELVYNSNAILKGFYLDDIDSEEMKIIRNSTITRLQNNMKDIDIKPCDIIFIISKISKASNKIKNNLTDIDKKYLSCKRMLISQLFSVYNDAFIKALKSQKTNNCYIIENIDINNEVMKNKIKDYDLYNHNYSLIIKKNKK